jgi:hypothetical protein
VHERRVAAIVYVCVGKNSELDLFNLGERREEEEGLIVMYIQKMNNYMALCSLGTCHRKASGRMPFTATSTGKPSSLTLPLDCSELGFVRGTPPRS